MSRHANMADKLFEKIHDSDMIAFGVAFDTIAYIGETNEGKLVLDSLSTISNS